MGPSRCLDKGEGDGTRLHCVGCPETEVQCVIVSWQAPALCLRKCSNLPHTQHLVPDVVDRDLQVCGEAMVMMWEVRQH